MAKFRKTLQECHFELIGWSDVLCEVLLAKTKEIFAVSAMQAIHFGRLWLNLSMLVMFKLLSDEPFNAESSRCQIQIYRETTLTRENATAKPWT